MSQIIDLTGGVTADTSSTSMPGSTLVPSSRMQAFLPPRASASASNVEFTVRSFRPLVNKEATAATTSNKNVTSTRSNYANNLDVTDEIVDQHEVSRVATKPATVPPKATPRKAPDTEHSRELAAIEVELAANEDEQSRLRARRQALLERKSTLLQLQRAATTTSTAASTSTMQSSRPHTVAKNTPDVRSSGGDDYLVERLHYFFADLRSFRPLQREVIEWALENRDAFVIMPTGGGDARVVVGI
jgi:hypothetical protein